MHRLLLALLLLVAPAGADPVCAPHTRAREENSTAWVCPRAEFRLPRVRAEELAAAVRRSRPDRRTAVLVVAAHCPFSAAMVPAVTAVAPAFPQVTFLLADAADVGGFVARFQTVLHGVPQLLLFRNGLYPDVYRPRELRGKEDAQALAGHLAWWVRAPAAAEVVVSADVQPVQLSESDGWLGPIAVAYTVVRGAVWLYRCVRGRPTA